MTQMEMAKEVARRTKVHFGDVCDVIECYETLLMKVIATEDYYQIGDVGVLQGVTKWPRPTNVPVFGWRQKKAQEYKKDWTWAKKGYPRMEFTTDAKMCIKQTAEEFFSEPPLKYCSAARAFRKSVGLPEIPEFDGLPEERVQKYCQEIDEQVMPKYQFKTNRDKEKMKEAIGYEAPGEKKKEELYNQWLIEQDMEKQKQMGIPEEEIVARDIAIVKKERRYELGVEGARRLTGNPDATIIEEEPENLPDNALYHYTEEEKADLRKYLDPTKAKRRKAKFGKKIMGS